MYINEGVKLKHKASGKVEESLSPVSYRDYLLDSMLNFDKFSRRLLKVQSIHGELVDFHLKPVQRLIADIISDIKKKGRLVRIVILKARREGVSTLIAGRFFWKTITNKNRYAMVITHEPEATDFLFNMHKRFLDHLPKPVKPEERYNNKRTLEFNNEEGTGLDSAIRVGTAGKEDFASSQLVHYLHLSEVAKWKRHVTTALLTSVLQCVPDTHDSEIIFESTGKGIGGAFYDKFWASRYFYTLYIKENGEIGFKEEINESAPAENEYTSIFIPYFVFQDYKKTPPNDFVLTEEESELKKLYNLSDDQIYWRRWTIENKCDGNAEIFKQEYPTNAKEAFISTSDAVFNTSKIMGLIAKAKNCIKRYSIKLSTGSFLQDDKGELQVWQEPDDKYLYLVSCDISEGNYKGDFSSLDVINTKTGVQVAHLHGKFPPDHLAVMAANIALRYNNAIICPERNNHGLTFINKLLDLGYSNIYFEEIVEPPARPRKRFGWLTTRQSKELVIDNLVIELRDDTIGINCKETLDEMLSFKRFEDGTCGAEEGMFDDRVMSYAIGKYIVSRLPYVNKNEKTKLYASYKYNQSENRKPKITPMSWT